jgi:hypothetical protein
MHQLYLMINFRLDSRNILLRLKQNCLERKKEVTG